MKTLVLADGTEKASVRTPGAETHVALLCLKSHWRQHFKVGVMRCYCVATLCGLQLVPVVFMRYACAVGHRTSSSKPG